MYIWPQQEKMSPQYYRTVFNCAIYRYNTFTAYHETRFIDKNWQMGKPNLTSHDSFIQVHVSCTSSLISQLKSYNQTVQCCNERYAQFAFTSWLRSLFSTIFRGIRFLAEIYKTNLTSQSSLNVCISNVTLEPM